MPQPTTGAGTETISDIALLPEGILPRFPLVSYFDAVRLLQKSRTSLIFAKVEWNILRRRFRFFHHRDNMGDSRLQSHRKTGMFRLMEKHTGFPMAFL